MAAMSGGVDSSVATALLIEKGYNVVGATLKLFTNEDIGGGPAGPDPAGLDPSSRVCCSLSDVEDARSVCYRLNIDHYVFNFGDDFGREVIGRFAKAYLEGRTPNPCIDCNRFIKFSKLLERARLLGMDYIATGHYARVMQDETSGRWLLKKSKDTSKDQTYVLAMLTQEQLSRTLFPLGSLTKPEVRAYAEEHGLINAKKPDSQDICFVPDGDYASFIEKRLGCRSEPGDFVDAGGTVLGRHRGIIHYTVGQRRGLGLSAGKPLYVVGKDLAANTVIVGGETELYTGSMTVADLNFISVEGIAEPTRVTVKTRYSQKETPATLFPPVDGRMAVVFDAPQRAVTPGQTAVFYDKDAVLGGGIIV
jgi:tRNA-specific 2-thiouridylase